MRPARYPARRPPGHSGPSSPNRSEDAFLGGVRNMTRHQQPQPEELSIAERLKMTLGAVAQGIRYTLKGEHQTEGKAQLTVEPEDVERIIAGWPAPQQNVARQLLAKYGPPNEATPTRLFWHHNRPWKRTELTSRSEEHTSELQSLTNLVCRLLLEKKKNIGAASRHHELTATGTHLI